MSIHKVWARSWENVSYGMCEQQRRRSACASGQSDQRLYCSLPRQNDTSSLYIRNFKILAGLCSWADQFVSCLVGDSQRHIFLWRGSYVFMENGWKLSFKTSWVGLIITKYAPYLLSHEVCSFKHTYTAILYGQKYGFLCYPSLFHIYYCKSPKNLDTVKNLL